MYNLSFDQMSKMLFKGERTQKQLKKKFEKELRDHPEMVHRALRTQINKGEGVTLRLRLSLSLSAACGLGVAIGCPWMKQSWPASQIPQASFATSGGGRCVTHRPGLLR